MESVRSTLVPVGVLEQILLVVVLSIVPESRLLYDCNNLLPFWSKVFLLHLLCYTASNRLLLWGVEEYGGAVLCIYVEFVKDGRRRKGTNGRVPRSKP